jgi:hypothetical protein
MPPVNVDYDRIPTVSSRRLVAVKSASAAHMSVIRGIFELSVVGGSASNSSRPESASIWTQEHRGLKY